MAKKKEQPGFEELLAELEKLVSRLEGGEGEVSLDEALTTYGRGVELARQGASLLEGAERRIEELKASLEDDA